MGKIKDLVSNNFEELKNSIRSFWATYIVSFVMTIILIVSYKFYDKNEMIFNHCLAFFACSILIIWLGELLFTKWLYKIISYVIAIGEGLAFSTLLFQDQEVGSYNEVVYRWVLGFIIATGLVCIFVAFKKSKLSTHKYLLDVVQNLFNYNIIFAVLNIGLNIVVGIFYSLILRKSFTDFFVELEMFLFGIVYIPMLIMAFTKKKSYITSFIKNLVKFVLMPITLAAMAIIYIYIFQCIIMVAIPSNYIFRCAAITFVLGFPNVIMIRNYKDDNKFYELSARFAPFAYIPFLILQIYSIAVRCSEYGMTVNRYLAIVFLIVEIGIVVLSLMKKDIIEFAVLLAAVCIIFATITPFNCVDVSVNSQVAKFKKAWQKGDKFDDLSKKEKKIAATSYMYIVGENKKDVMPTYISQKEYKKLADYYFETDFTETIDEDSPDRFKKEVYFYASPDEVVDISKYDRMVTDESLANYSIVATKREYYDLFDSIIEEHGRDLEKELKKCHLYELNAEIDIYIESIEASYTYDGDDENIDIGEYRVTYTELYKKQDE
ncbi:MAG: DUF4153 domain-containing protein [Lachnospiraceae bacterium]|nr:DUF4153 domain-containing protein [Lachnospiraceae bacterium]